MRFCLHCRVLNLIKYSDLKTEFFFIFTTVNLNPKIELKKYQNIPMPMSKHKLN